MLGGSDHHKTEGPEELQPSPDDVRAHLQHVLESADLQLPARARKFLSYIVEETLAGRSDRIKAYTIGIEVFERDPTFDAQSDPVVRIEAGRLRRALERYYFLAGRTDPVVIQIPKGGYVPRFSTGDAQPAEPSVHVSLPLETAKSTRPARRVAVWFGAGAVGLAALFVGIGLLGGSPDVSKNEFRSSPQLLPAGPTLIVVPFASLGDHPDTKVYAEGLTEEVLGQLARFKELSVLGRETSRALPPDADVARIRRELGVRYVLEGSVRTAAHRLRIAGRLLDAETGAVLWSHDYDEDLRIRDFFSIQDEVAQKVATAVAQPYGIVFRADERHIERRIAADLEAYHCTLRFYDYRAELSPEKHLEIRTCLERAVSRYPSYATAWAMVSFLHLDEDRFGFNARAGSPSPLQRSIDAAREAIRLDPENVRALQAMMMTLFFTEQPAKALQVGERAVALNPNDTELLGDYAARIGQNGDWERGTAILEQALARNPSLSGYYHGVLALHAYMQHDYRRAEVLFRDVSLEKFPLYHFVGAIIYAQLGMTSEAAAARSTFMKMRPAFFDRWDREVARRNYRAADAAHLAQGARKAGFPVPDDALAPHSESAVR